MSGKNALCLSCDRKYAKYAYVAIYSALQNLSEDYHTEIYLLSQNMPEDLLPYFEQLSSERVPIHIIDMQEYIVKFGIDKLFTSRHITTAAYFRFFIPEMFSNYTRIFYIDCDTVVLGDCKEIFEYSDDNDLCLGVVLDSGRNRLPFYSKKFIEEHIKISIHDYFNDGVLLYNIDKCLNFRLREKCFDFLKKYQKPPFHDQDTLNSVVKFNKFKIPFSWNVLVSLDKKNVLNKIMRKSESYLRNYYNNVKSFYNPKIIHYAGVSKPWNVPDMTYGYFWWQYAKQTPLYQYYLSNYKQRKILEVI